MFDLMAKPDEESQVTGRVLVDGRVVAIQATLKLPVPVRPVFRSVEDAAIGSLSEVTILDATSTVVCVKEVSPCNRHQDNERF